MLKNLSRDWCVRILVAGVIAIATSACGSSSTAPTATTSPTAPAAAASTSLNLAGTWTGTLGSANNSNPLKVTWAATQSGAAVTGALTIVTDFADPGQPPNPQTFNGTMSGAISGTQVAFTITLPAGTFISVGSATCSVAGTGASSSASATSLAGTITLTFAPACVGVVTDPGKSTETDQLSLTKS